MIPFPEDTDDRVRWVLNHARAWRSNIMIDAYQRYDTDVQSWLFAQYGIRSKPNGKKLRASNLLFPILDAEAARLGLTTTPFHESKSKQHAIVVLLREKAVIERRRLMELLYQRDGKRGCLTCGNTDDTLLEFVHNGSSSRRSPMFCISRFHWKQGELEAMKCHILCITCRRKRTGAMVRALLLGSGKTQGSNKERRARGVQRYLDAKLSAEFCQICKRECTEDTARQFDFDHLNVDTKRANLSQFLTHSDKTFATELAKCRLLCVKCHRTNTTEQIDRGDLIRKRYNTKRAREEEEQGDVYAQQQPPTKRPRVGVVDVDDAADESSDDVFYLPPLQSYVTTYPLVIVSTLPRLKLI